MVKQGAVQTVCWLMGLMAGILLLVIAMPGHAAAAAAREPSLDKELWYIIQIDGKKAGWMRDEQRTAEGRITSIAELQFELKRMSASVKIQMSTEFVESMKGEPISMKSTMSLGPTPQTTEYTFTADGIESRTSGRDTVTKHPKPEGMWLTPAAAESFIRQRLAAKATEITVRTMVPETGPKPITVTRSGFEPTTVEAFGKSLAAIKCLNVTLTPSEPGKEGRTESTEYIDEQGELLRTRVNAGGIIMDLIAADKALALAPSEAPELMARTFVTPGKRIVNPRSKFKAVYKLHLADGAAMPDLAETGMQRVERVDGPALRVTVDAMAFRPATEKEVKNEAYRKRSAMVDSEDPEIVKIAENARKSREKRGGEEGDEGAMQLELARSLQRTVYNKIKKKSLDVGFASASDAVRTGEGDCSEHAVLLAAVLRSAGIPSRTVSGLVYVEDLGEAKGVFGYHMWAEALITIDGSPRWVGLDATMANLKPDATHIAIATSAMEDAGTMNSFVTLMPLLGNLKIDVESME